MQCNLPQHRAAAPQAGLTLVELIVTVAILAILASAVVPLARDRLVPGEDAQGKKLKFLRRIPVDPMTGKAEWTLRSMQDDPNSDSWGGQSVFDVASKSQGIALDGTKYSDW